MFLMCSSDDLLYGFKAVTYAKQNRARAPDLWDCFCCVSVACGFVDLRQSETAYSFDSAGRTVICLCSLNKAPPDHLSVFSCVCLYGYVNLQKMQQPVMKGWIEACKL